MSSPLLSITPVIPSQNIERDVEWYKQKVGFISAFYDNMYAVLYRDDIYIHLQWHADTADDPLLGGSVIRIYVTDIQLLFKEFVDRGTVSADKLRLNTPWHTHEFGFYDLNNNAIFIVEVLKP
jgi:hypothetical protein